MRPNFKTFAGLALLVLLLAGCDRCGDPVQLNVPGAPKSCYGETPPK
jgi:predicted small lipoprotein YifL